MVRGNTKLSQWLVIGAGVLAAAFLMMTPPVFAQNARVLVLQRNFVEPGDPARELFNHGQSLYDQFRYLEAEKTFREVVAKYSNSNIADKAEYYLIRTLGQLGKTPEALTRVKAFPKTYPRSTWTPDVEEFAMQWTDQAPGVARSILIRRAPALTLAPADIQAVNQQISLMQEALRVMFRSDVTDALQITNDRLKTNMADPVALSVLGMIATTAAPQGLPILVDVAKNSPSMRARKDAIYWMSQGPGDKDMTIDTLMGLLPAASEDTTDAVTFSLAQIRTEKAYNALAGIVLDKTRSESLRKLALVRLGQNHDLRAKDALENITTSDTDGRFRMEALQILEALLRRR
ncbi:MAG TPA: outer membrane protein assembly factor BamD [Terriglobia bacterium]|jgi:tetratricopeptide (TPR) repeat protein